MSTTELARTPSSLTEAIEALSAERIELAEAPRHAGGPSNEELATAFRDWAKPRSRVLDKCSDAALAFVKSGYGSNAVQEARKTPPDAWKSGKAPIKEVQEWRTHGWSEVVEEVKSDRLITTCLLGVNISGDLLLGLEGGVGVSWDVLNREPARATLWGCGRLGLSIDLGLNVVFAGSSLLPSQLQGGPVGNSTLYWGLSAHATIGGPIGVGARLTVLFTHDPASGLRFAAFMIALGVKTGIGISAVMGRFLVP